MLHRKPHKILHLVNLDPFVVESRCLHQNVWQRLLSTNQYKIDSFQTGSLMCEITCLILLIFLVCIYRKALSDESILVSF